MGHEEFPHTTASSITSLEPDDLDRGREATATVTSQRPRPRSAPPPPAIKLLRNGEQAYPAWLEAIASAREEILLEMYWFASDATGQRFADALAERARAGVDVFVLYDSVGSLGTDRAVFDRIAQAGGTVLEFHPIAPWRKRFRLDQISLRDHRKILVCDARVAFTGGINICDQAAPKSEGGEGWRDDAVKITGESVLEIRKLFFDNWLRLGGPTPRRGAAVARRARRELLAAARAQAILDAEEDRERDGERAAVGWRERISWLGSRRERTIPSEITHRNPGGAIVRTSTRAIAQAPTVQVLGHQTWGVRKSIRNLYVRKINQARRSILIANSYFLPDGIVRKALERAAARGVEVRVMVPAKSDVPSVGYASRALFARLMRAGVHVHQWIDGMMHAKTAVVDDWATVGSYNLDYRSLRYNLEVNVASQDEDFVRSVGESVRADLARAPEIDPKEWRFRPALEKTLEWFYYLLRRIL